MRKYLYLNILRIQKLLYSVCLSIFFSTLVLSQDIIQGNFLIENFSKIKSGAGTQNWASACLPNGKIVIANNGGLLKFDGANWDIFPLPNKTIARSLSVVDQNHIFIGGQDEIGFYNERDQFISIRDLIPSDHLPLEDVWQMIFLDSTLYFRSLNKIFQYHLRDDSIKVFDPSSAIYSIINYEDKIYFHTADKGLLTLSDSNDLLKYSGVLDNSIILDIINFNGEVLFITESDGIYKLKNDQVIEFNKDLNRYLSANKLFNATVIWDDKLIIGTQFDGVVIVDTEGSVIDRISKSEGLLNNNIHTLTQDMSGNLWAGTSNGIAKIDISTSIKEIQPDENQSSSFYDVQKFRDKIYFASNNGVFATIDSSDPKYELVRNTEGQAWGLDAIGNNLLIGHNNTPFTIEDESAIPISENIGVWKFVPTSKPNFMYAGTYDGIDIYQRDVGGRWKIYKHLEGFSESARILVTVSENELWISHPYRGVYKIIHDDDFELLDIKSYGYREGLPSDLQNYIFEINGLPYVTGLKSIYRYDSVKDEFVYDSVLNSYLNPDQNVSRLFQDGKDNIWFTAEKEVGVLRKIGEDKYVKKVFPELIDQLVGGFEQISFIDSNRVFVCTNQNVLVINRQFEKEEKEPLLNFHEVRLIENQDSLVHENHIELTSKQNALRFTYSSPNHRKGILYQYNLLRNGDGRWSTWSIENKKEFTNLDYGEYTFMIKCKSANGLQSQIQSFEFTILPPWYSSKIAKTIYALATIGMLLGIVLIPRKKYQKDKEQLIEAKNQSEEELEKVKTEKLNAELASSTLHLVQKNDTINKIRNELESFKEKIKDTALKRELKRVLSVVNDDVRLENDWERFSSHFDQVHTNFLSRLTDEFPEITPKDQKLCAYLRMNLTTKEIAPLLHISVRGVEISRYRLRKKLGLSKEVNLNEFMMNY